MGFLRAGLGAVVLICFNGVSLAVAEQDAVRPFTISIPDATLQHIISDVSRAELPDSWATANWKDGVDPGFMRDMQAYWIEQYNWRRLEERLNQPESLAVTVDDIKVHVLRRRAEGERSVGAIMLLHGWPHNMLAFLDVMGPLSRPDEFGAPSAPAFDVVVPSYPGFGFSDKPQSPIGPKRLGEILHRVMGALGYERYLIQAGDIGALIAPWMALTQPQAVKGIHLNHVFVRSSEYRLGSGQMLAPDSTEEERKFMLREAEAMNLVALAYFYQQAGRPQTLAYGLADSSLGAAAWYWDRFFLWSDRAGGSMLEVFSADHLIDQIMVYLVTGTQDTATWVYRGLFDEAAIDLPDGARVNVPVGVFLTADPLNPPPPRSLIERDYNLVRYMATGRGGHWPMLETPEAFVADIRAFGEVIGSGE